MKVWVWKRDDSISIQAGGKAPMVGHCGVNCCGYYGDSNLTLDVCKAELIRGLFKGLRTNGAPKQFELSAKAL